MPPEDVIVASRPATIGLIVQTRQDGALGVVLQGLMKGRWFGESNVALDGFYKHLDGTVEVMPDDELDRFD